MMDIDIINQKREMEMRKRNRMKKKQETDKQKERKYEQMTSGQKKSIKGGQRLTIGAKIPLGFLIEFNQIKSNY